MTPTRIYDNVHRPKSVVSRYPRAYTGTARMVNGVQHFTVKKTVSYAEAVACFPPNNPVLSPASLLTPDMYHKAWVAVTHIVYPYVDTDFKRKAWVEYCTEPTGDWVDLTKPLSKRDVKRIRYYGFTPISQGKGGKLIQLHPTLYTPFT